MAKVFLWFTTTLLCLVLGLGLILQLNHTKLQEQQSIAAQFEVDKGQSTQAVIQKLADQKLINCGLCLRVSLRLQALLGAKVGYAQAGDYEFAGDFSSYEVFNTLVRGDTVKYRITLIAGLTLDKWLLKLWAHPQIKKTLNVSADRATLYPALKKAFNLQAANPEGLFLPETYEFDKNTSEIKILKRAHNLMNKTLEKAWDQRGTTIPLKTAYEALILASIIEKETGVPQERPLISGVFTNRLRKNMRLETDPTVIYGIAEYDGNITRNHLKTKTAYNTYQMTGLPPTPIAAPSRAAVFAAVKPKTTEALFFVAKGDGSHQFSTTYAEHKAAIKAYQLKLRENYRSSPQSIESDISKSKASANADLPKE